MLLEVYSVHELQISAAVGSREFVEPSAPKKKHNSRHTSRSFTLLLLFKLTGRAQPQHDTHIVSANIKICTNKNYCLLYYIVGQSVVVVIRVQLIKLIALGALLPLVALCSVHTGMSG